MRILPLLAGMLLIGVPGAAQANVALMGSQPARALHGQFNSVPVLHSNQPEEVEGPGILITTAPGSSYAQEAGEWLRNAEYTFNGEFGVHMHHKYFPPYRSSISPSNRRSELTLGLILINPGTRPVQVNFEKGAVRNSFEAPYLANNLMGVKPLGPRPWNTGPGDATAVQMLRGKLDNRLADGLQIPPRSRVVLFQTALPALGIANALLRGRTDGPIQMAVVAARNPRGDSDLLSVLDQGQLAPGRVYLRRIAEINNRQVFSRVGGVAIGDQYVAQLSHDLNQQGPLHVPLTSTSRHHFGTQEIQVNRLVARMVDSSLDNVGTYGVRFDLDLKLRGQGPYQLVLSHPSPAPGMRAFTAFRGSLQIRTESGLEEVHVGLRSGESLPLTTLNLRPGVVSPVRVSLVYPADATPGHLLSVVPAAQMARLPAATEVRPVVAIRPQQSAPAGQGRPSTTSAVILHPSAKANTNGVRMSAADLSPAPLRYNSVEPLAGALIDRYRQALEAQQKQMRELSER